MNQQPARRGLLLDFGSVISKSPFEMLDELLRRRGMPVEVIRGRGPFTPGEDQRWEALCAGEISERDYWTALARQVGAAFGEEWTPLELTAALYCGSDETFIRPEAVALVEDAQRAGLPTGILTNDLELFHGRAWMERVSILKSVDAMVDASVTGVLKPDPDAYRAAAASLGVDPCELVFIDDQYPNVAGAEAAELLAVHLDVTDPGLAFAQARRLLGLLVPLSSL